MVEVAETELTPTPLSDSPSLAVLLDDASPVELSMPPVGAPAAVEEEEEEEEEAAHTSVLQACEDAPVQLAPPPDGAGLVQVRVRVPPPQALEHAFQSVQLPLTVAGHVEGNQLFALVLQEPSVAPDAEPLAHAPVASHQPHPLDL
jgi:hypothetical protein